MTFWHIAVPTAAAVAGVSAWGAFHPASQLFGPTVRNTNSGSALALSFDDGPNPQATPQLLDFLDKHQVRATFFLIGKHVRLYPQLAADLAARGHTVGNHTETHPSLTWLSSERIASELSRCQQSIEQATGRPARWMRPPYGFRGPQLNPVVKSKGYDGVVMWSLSARDWNPQSPSRVIARLRKARGGDIILLHDGDHRNACADRSHTLRALEFWLPRWKDAGLVFVTPNGC
ncbi:MAG TPA: polysaccharide deacetylase family protein [Acidobacteriota bacterium]|jgi:peptidoglycan/xylan/chitin deacetylase (PgdA/CDA1 family)